MRSSRGRPITPTYGPSDEAQQPAHLGVIPLHFGDPYRGMAAFHPLLCELLRSRRTLPPAVPGVASINRVGCPFAVFLVPINGVGAQETAHDKPDLDAISDFRCSRHALTVRDRLVSWVVVRNVYPARFVSRYLQILYDKAGRKIEISATVSEAVADAFENQKALPKEGSLVVVRDIAGAGFEPATFGL